ncbi:MAG: hypothetical protein IPN29_20990 [Saprospiraceae bacterium]|nr:hypothetical protein [Saprospiraceae bacterium]
MHKIILIFGFALTMVFTTTSCKKDVIGCTNPKAENYDPDANIQGDCVIKGCTNPKAENYNPDATLDDGFCIIKGCTNPLSENYDPQANVDNGSCIIKGCTDPTASNYNPLANTPDGSCKYAKDQFIGNYTGKLTCNNALIQQFIAGQALDITIEEIPGEKNKVKLSLGLAIPGLQSPTGTIEGKKLSYESPEQTLTIPINGNPTTVTISNSGELIAGTDPNKLTGTISLKIVIGILPIEDSCTLEATRK